MTPHPATMYGFVLAVIGLIGTIVLVALGDVASDVGVPVIVGLGSGSLGGALGIAVPARVATVTSDNP